jgi:integrase
VKTSTSKWAASLPRVGSPHFAHLRAVAQGVPVLRAARRYLAIEEGEEARAVHLRVVDQVRAIARRRGDSRWRLIGVEIASPPAPDARPPLDTWAGAEGLGGWSHAELQDMYAERFGTADRHEARRHARNARLRARRLALLHELEATTATPALPTDPLDGWLEPGLAHQLWQRGALTLADLRERIDRGGRWWLGLKGFGPTKAARLAAFARALLPEPWPAPGWSPALAQRGLAGFSGAQGRNRVRAAFAGTDASDDHEAVQRWVAARAASPHTQKQYTREAERFILWCVLERGKAMSDATAEDCGAYMAFVADVPPAWVSRRNVERHAAGWAPFRGSLDLASQKLALAALHSLFAWLVKANYLASNPWVLVNRKLGDDPRQGGDDDGSRAFTPAAWGALQACLDASPASPSMARLRWLCVFVEGTGLRAAELLRAQLGDLQRTKSGWVIKVHGKGRRNRTVVVPSAAMRATLAYLGERGIELEQASPEAPLLASLEDPDRAITYSALHQTFTRFTKRAVQALPLAERRQAAFASAHWLRHTHATRAAERGVPPDVLQENLGQSDPRTTARYYRAQIERRQRAMEEAFGR